MDNNHVIQYLMSDRLEPHPIAQRAFNRQHANNISKNFNINLMQPLTVSYRDGVYYILDGQHRKYAAEKHNGGPVLLECKVYYGLTNKEEVEIFKGLNVGVKIPRIEDVMHVDYRNDESYAIDIANTCKEFGFECSFGEMYRDRNVKYGKRIAASHALKVAYEKLGSVGFRDMIEVIAKAWGCDPDSVRADMLKGFTLFWEKYSDVVDKESLILRLKKESPATIARVSYVGKSANASRAFAILCIYNAGRAASRQILADKL